MSATISYMYRTSGGCDKENTCAKCAYLKKQKDAGRTEYSCSLHSSMTGEDAPWKETHMACKQFQHRSKPKYRMDSIGQFCLF